MTIDSFEDAPRTARVVSHHRDGYVVRLESLEVSARLPGRFRHTASTAESLPAVGDWVTVTLGPSDASVAIIQAVYPRRGAFLRKTAGDATTVQVVAANVDVAFIAVALPHDVNHRRIERYLALAWESGATPVVLLTKADLVDDAEPFIQDARSVAPGVDVLAVSTVTGAGLDALGRLLSRDVTAVLLGSSGAGKSTIVNALIGDERQRIAAVRSDGRGRHTTTHRQLFALPSGGCIVDTPGMRELQLWSAADGLEETFRDIATLAGECRFRDCAHRTEPGCAVLAAVERGALEAARLASWHDLARELAYLERRQDAAAKASARASARSAEYAMRFRLRDKYGDQS